MKCTVKERIKSILDDNCLSINAASKLLDVNYRTLNHQINGESEVSLETLTKLKETFPEYSLDWIITGRSYANLNVDNDDEIPLYDAESVVGFGKADKLNEQHIKAKYRIKEFTAATFMLLVKDDSMSPTYNNDDIIAVKTIRDFSLIHWGKPHLIDCHGRLFVKRIYQDNDLIIALSDNHSYTPICLRNEDITGIAAIIGCVKPENYRQVLEVKSL